MNIAICVCTYKRSEGLRKLLDSLSKMYFDEGKFVLFVADNDAVDHIGYDFLQIHKHEYPFEIRCEIEPGIGICHARNKTLAMVRDSGMKFDFVAFTDDDVEVSPIWLRDLVRTADFYQADLVGAKLEPLFETKPSDDVLNSSFFNISSPPTGTQIKSMGTHNVMMRSNIFEKEGYNLFDLNLSIFGGSDMDVGTMLHLKNYKMVWCATAYVYETFPTARLNTEWVLQRYFRSGTSYAYIVNKRMGTKKLWLSSVKKIIMLPYRYFRSLFSPTSNNKSIFYNDLGFLYFLFKGLSKPEYKRN